MRNDNLLRLGFHYHVPAVSRDGHIYMPGSLGRFLDGLAVHFQRVVCFLHAPRWSELAQMDYRILAENVELVEIGPRVSVPARELFAPRFTHPLKKRLDDLDLVLVRGPSPLLPAMTNAARPLPTALLIVGDYLSGVNDLPQPGWRKELIRAWSRRNTRQQWQVARRSLTIVNSHKLFCQAEAEIQNLVEIRTTTLTAADFFLREDTCQAAPYHVLYTGRMAREKGLLDALEALSILKKDGIDIVFDLVGPQENNDPLLDEIKTRANLLDVSGQVVYHGYRPIGPELFDFYIQSDIYLIASHHEGFPRTIWEAMAHGLPVTATSVGSIPDYLQNGREALLVPSKQPQEMAAALKRLILEPGLRRGLIQNGYRLARENSIETRSTEMAHQIITWMSGSQKINSRVAARLNKKSP
jgi:glycosyltransferase involved in cell wall biosynthesis